MVLQYSSISKDEKTIRSHTGLTKAEFEALAFMFGQEWGHYIRHYTWEGKLRQRQSRERKNSVLVTVEDKLLFLLYYFKLNPLQEVLATAFGMNQPQASKWLELLRSRLLEALDREKVLPERKAERLYRALSTETRVIIDATERSVGRSVDDETQKEYYSGKKSHTIKNVLIAGADKKILYLSQTYEGSVHDKKIADEAEIEFGKTTEPLLDSGFQGFAPEKANIEMPVKKPKAHRWAEAGKQKESLPESSCRTCYWTAKSVADCKR